ncbi:hypothetical protein [Metamycoplasma equirhinis]
MYKSDLGDLFINSSNIMPFEILDFSTNYNKRILYFVKKYWLS